MRCVPALAAIWITGCASTPPGIENLPLESLDGCALEGLEQVRGLDVAIAIDTSGSTARPSGADIDRDGSTGVLRYGTTTDPDDSLLAAQVAAIRPLVAEARARDLRVSIIHYAGGIWFRDPASPAVPEAVFGRSELTSDPEALDAELGRVLRRGSRGTAGFSAAMEQSLKALDLRSESPTPRRQVVLMISDGATPLRAGPTRYYYRSPVHAEGIPRGSSVRSDPAMAVVAKQAIRAGVVIHTFGLGEAAWPDPPHSLSRVARATGGSYRTARDPTRLHCSLASALVP